jgi:hypothetical protein
MMLIGFTIVTLAGKTYFYSIISSRSRGDKKSVGALFARRTLNLEFPASNPKRQELSHVTHIMAFLRSVYEH